jgi:hypothetical protein
MKLASLPSDVPQPEPEAIDERIQLELQYLAHNASLKGQPSGSERCGNCRYYLEPEEQLSYCWHMKLRILVDDDWWCRWWRPIRD